MPGAFNGFEMAVRAILGQQVTVRAASTLAARFAVGTSATRSPLPFAVSDPSVPYPRARVAAARPEDLVCTRHPPDARPFDPLP